MGEKEPGSLPSHPPYNLETGGRVFCSKPLPLFLLLVRFLLHASPHHCLPPVPPRLFTANIIEQLSGLHLPVSQISLIILHRINRSLLRWSISLKASRIDRPAVDLCSVVQQPSVSKQPIITTTQRIFKKSIWGNLPSCPPALSPSLLLLLLPPLLSPFPTLPALNPPPGQRERPSPPFSASANQSTTYLL